MALSMFILLHIRCRLYQHIFIFCISGQCIGWFGLMVFNATFNNISVISWWTVLLGEENGVPGENHRPVASH
jgi:hypothetical protein